MSKRWNTETVVSHIVGDVSVEFASIPYCIVLSHDGWNRILSTHATLAEAQTKLEQYRLDPHSVLTDRDCDLTTVNQAYHISIIHLIDGYCVSTVGAYYHSREDARICSFRL